MESSTNFNLMGGGVDISQSSNRKFLDLIIDEKLTCAQHIINLFTNFQKYWYFMHTNTYTDKNHAV